MSFFLVGGGYDESLTDVHDEFVQQARQHDPEAPVVVVVAGPASESADHAAELAGIVTSRWPEATILTIHLDGPGTAPTIGDPAAAQWAEDESFTLPDGLDQVAGIIVGGGWVPSYVNGLAPAADLLSRAVRGGAPWLGFSAGAMATSVTALAGGWKLRDRQVGQHAGAEGFEEVTLVEGLGLVSLTVATHNDTLSGDGLLVSAIENGLLGQAVAIDEGTCLCVDATSGRTRVMGHGLVRWYSRDAGGVLVRSERSRDQKPAPAPKRPRFAGLAKVAAATRAAHDKEEREKEERQKAPQPEPADRIPSEPVPSHDEPHADGSDAPDNSAPTDHTPADHDPEQESADHES